MITIMKDCKKIIAMFKTHFDIGFTGLAAEVIQKYGTNMLRDVITTCEGTQNAEKQDEFVWTMASWPLRKTLETASAADRERAQRLIERGQIAAHALPFTTHTEFLGCEELNRIGGFTARFCEAYHKPFPIAAKMTDVPGHTVYLASVLAKLGVKFFHIGVNPASMPVDLPMLFWWEGQDGGRILTFYSKGSYGSGLLPPKEWQFPVWLAILQSNDNAGPQKPDVIENLKEQLKCRDSGATLSVGTMDDFYREIVKCDLSGLPVIKTDFADSWIHGVGTYPQEVSALRRNRRAVCAIEKADSLFLGGEAGKEHLDKIYEASTLFGEHTWGLDVKSNLGYARSYDKANFLKERETFASYHRMEQSWEEQRARAAFTKAETGRYFEKVKAKLLKTDKKAITVFNPHAKAFNGYVDVTSCLGENEGLALSGKDLEILRAGKSVYVKAALPPLSLGVFEKTQKAALSEIFEREDSETAELGNGLLHLTVCKKSGAIVSLIDAQCGKNQVLNAEYTYETVGPERIASYIREYSYRFFDWSANDFGRMSYPMNFEGKEYKTVAESVCLDGQSIKAVLKPEDKESFTEFGNCKRIEITYALKGNALNIKLALLEKQASPIVEGGQFGFTFNIAKPKYKLNKVGSVLDLETDIAKNANHAMYCMENWLDISDGENGVAVVSHDAPLFSVGGSAIYRFAGEYAAREDCRVEFNLFNNMWGTNFPQWTEGDFFYEFDVLPHRGDFTKVCDALDELTAPPLVFDGTRPAADSDGQLAVSGGKLLAVLTAEDGVLCRIAETNKQAGKIELSGKRTEGEIVLCDLNGNEIKACGKVFPTGPLEVHTVKLRRK